MNFLKRLNLAIETHSPLCVGLDPLIEKIPLHFRNEKNPLFTFNKEIIDATASLVGAFKPQMAYYSSQRAEKDLELTCEYIKKNYPQHILILDGKRQDIGETAKQYAQEVYERYLADIVTVCAYMGEDSLQEFLSYKERGIFVLCKTSNPSASTFQDLILKDGMRLCEKLAQTVTKLGGPSQVGLVIGATQSQELTTMRKFCAEETPFLVPGVGAQGAQFCEAYEHGKNKSNKGVFISASRSIIYASQGRDFAQQAREVCKKYLLESPDFNHLSP